MNDAPSGKEMVFPCSHEDASGLPGWRVARDDGEMYKAVVWLIGLGLAFQTLGVVLAVWHGDIPVIREITEGPYAHATEGLKVLRSTGRLSLGDVGFRELATAFVERGRGLTEGGADRRVVGLSWRRAPYEAESYVAPRYAYPIVAAFSDGWTDAMDPRNMVSYVDSLPTRLDALWPGLFFLGAVLGVVGGGLQRRWQREHPAEVVSREKPLLPWWR